EVSPLEVLKGQGSFLAGLAFSTCWAQQLFPQELIQAKIGEVEQLLRLLKAAPLSAAHDWRPAKASDYPLWVLNGVGPEVCCGNGVQDSAHVGGALRPERV